MRRHKHFWKWLLGGAVATVALLLGGSPARAGITIVGGGIKPFGDPFYFYIVKVYLDPTFQFLNGDSFTLNTLAGVNSSGSTTGQPSGSPSGPWTPIIRNRGTGPIPNFSPPTIVPLADVTWRNAGPDIFNPGGTGKSLGEFRVLTAISLPELPKSYTVEVGWTAQLHDANGDPFRDSGVVVLGMIPEPTSAILLAGGLGLPVLLWRRSRLRRTGA